MNYEAEYSHQFVSLSKNFIYFSIKIYFFYFTYSFKKKNKKSQIRLSILYYTMSIILKYQIFLIVSLFSHIITIIHYFPLVLEYVKKE